MPNYRNSNVKLKKKSLASLVQGFKSYTYRYIIKAILFSDRNLFVGKINKSKYNLESKNNRLPNYFPELKSFYNDSYSRNSYKLSATDANLEFKVTYEIPGYKILKNVIYIPSQGLYSENGDFVNYSYPYSHKHDIPKKIDKISRGIDYVNTEFLYIGKFESLHYGHFLTEGISHLWGIKDYDDLPLLYNGYEWSPKNVFSVRKKHLYMDDFLINVGLDRNKLFYFSKPVKLRSVIMPNPSLVFGESVNIIHKLLPEFVSNKYCKDFDEKEKTSQPVYFSRNRLTSNQRLRFVYNEDLLEKYLSNKGVKIVYPEILDLKQQIHLVNKHKYVVGCQGSALHNIIFSLNQDIQLFCLADRNTWLGTYYMIDAIKSAKSQYIFSLEEVSKKSQTNGEFDSSRKDKIVNLETTISELERIGLV